MKKMLYSSKNICKIKRFRITIKDMNYNTYSMIEFSYLFEITEYYSFVEILIKAQGQTLFSGLDDTLKSLTSRIRQNRD